MTDPANAPGDAAPELLDTPDDGAGGEGTGESADRSRDASCPVDGGPLPRVPDVGGDTAGATVPPAGERRAEGTPDGADPLRPIRYRRRAADAEVDPHEGGDGPTAAPTGAAASADGDSPDRAGNAADHPGSAGGAEECCAGGCDCGGRAATDGGGAGAVNVDESGSLGDIEFTAPAAGTSQDLESSDRTERVNPPEDVDLDTPGYGIRREMNDIEEPEDKTWFMELDAAVIQADRCIQCGTCVAACPSDSIGVGEDGLPELVKMCTGCSLCWDFCPRGGLRYERQWKITGGEDNVKGAGDPITEFSARVEDDWRENAQDGGLVTSVLVHLLEAGEIDGALIATESDEEAWKAESFLATTPEECIENAGSVYNQTLALGNLDIERWEHKLPDKDPEDLSLALVGTPCEIEGIRAVQDFDWEYGSQEAGVRAVEYTIALMCTKNFNYYSLMGELIEDERGIDRADIGKMDVLHGKMMAYDHDGELLLEEDVENFHDAALKGCDECADFTGYCADLTVGSVGSDEEYSSVIVRTQTGLDAWNLTKEDLDYHDLEDRSAVGKLQGWDKKKAFESLKRPFDPDAPRFIDYADHVEAYGGELHPHEADH